MYISKKSILVVVILLILSHPIIAQVSKADQIDLLLKKYNESGTFNGNVLVSLNNKVLYNSSFGFSDATKTEKLTPDYRFNIGSITKEFSAVALLQLQEKGKLKLEDKVSKFMPELSKWADEVTIKDLLQYTSGIPNVIWKNIKNDKDLLNGLKLIDSLAFEPGTQYDYNNNTIFLRHFIIEKITGMSYKSYVTKYLFKKCKMLTAVMTPFEFEENIAKGFNTKLIQDKPDLPITGGTYLTTLDLLKWVRCLHSKKLLNQNSLYIIGQYYADESNQSGLGQATYSDKKLITHVHDGSAENYKALLVSAINSKYSVILLSNSNSGKIFEISTAIEEILKIK